MKIRSLLEFDDPPPEYDPKSRLFTLCLNFGGKFTLGPQSTYVRGESYKFDYVELDSLLFESLEKLAIHEGVLGPMRFYSELEPGYLLINNTTDLHKVIEEKLTKVREVNIFIEELSNEVFNDGNVKRNESVIVAEAGPPRNAEILMKGIFSSITDLDIVETIGFREAFGWIKEKLHDVVLSRSLCSFTWCFFRERLAATTETLGIRADPSLFVCERKGRIFCAVFWTLVSVYVVKQQKICFSF
ncbi:hypothetical protein DH2020_014748 [Rehmannia glutinosa]|uniref:Uncharacterized protein n=1 Tax=Rehmannia glutinosa TaxID=99300 RepID=A0ABR0WXC6_REHGL